MSHFAKVIDGIVTEVLVIEQDVLDTGLFGDPALFVQTSYNTRGGQHPEGRPLRKNFAGVGYTYDPVLDAFYAPEPYPSWALDMETCLWVAPVACPDDGEQYAWDEETLSWVEAVIAEPEVEPETAPPVLSTVTSATATLEAAPALSTALSTSTVNE